MAEHQRSRQQEALVILKEANREAKIRDRCDQRLLALFERQAQGRLLRLCFAAIKDEIEADTAQGKLLHVSLLKLTTSLRANHLRCLRAGFNKLKEGSARAILEEQSANILKKGKQEIKQQKSQLSQQQQMLAQKENKLQQRANEIEKKESKVEKREAQAKLMAHVPRARNQALQSNPLLASSNSESILNHDRLKEINRYMQSEQDLVCDDPANVPLLPSDSSGAKSKKSKIQSQLSKNASAYLQADTGDYRSETSKRAPKDMTKYITPMRTFKVNRQKKRADSKSGGKLVTQSSSTKLKPLCLNTMVLEKPQP